MGELSTVGVFALTVVGTAIGIVGTAWLNKELKDHGWPGLRRTVGNVGFMLMIAHAVLLLALAFYCAAYDAIHQFGPNNPYWPVPRSAVWFEGAVIPGFFAAVLFHFRKNVMMLVAGLLKWVWVALYVYAFFKYGGSIRGDDYFAVQAESFIAWSMFMEGFLVVVAAAAAAISYLNGIVDSLD